MTRDLKADLKHLADLEELEFTKRERGYFYDAENFIAKNGEEWLFQAVAEKERADKYETFVQKLIADLYIILRGIISYDHESEGVFDLENIVAVLEACKRVKEVFDNEYQRKNL